MRREPLECHVRFNPSRQSIASSSTRTASMTGTTGRASNTKAGDIEHRSTCGVSESGPGHRIFWEMTGDYLRPPLPPPPRLELAAFAAAL